MNKLAIIIFMLFMLALTAVNYVRHMPAESRPAPVLDGWIQGEFVTYRKTYDHGCGGTLTFNGKTDRAPYSETDVFYTHVCDKCGTTNQMLNAHWPQFKREWRDSK
jgi:hypothetical protein